MPYRNQAHQSAGAGNATDVTAVDPTRALTAAAEAVWRPVSGFMEFVATGVVQAIQEARTRKALMELSDDALRDIGLSRSEIRAVAREVTLHPDGERRPGWYS